MSQESEIVTRAASIGELQLEAFDSVVDAGATVVAPGRVTNRADHEVRVVMLVQGLPPGWCPSAHVLTLPAHNTAEVFLYLSPPVGTPPGRYLWSLTAETADQPMQAATAELTVQRPQPRPARPGTRPTYRRWVLPAVALGIVAALVAAVVALIPDSHDRRTPQAGGNERTERAQPKPPSKVVQVSGSIRAEGVQQVREVGISHMSLRLPQISNLGSGRPGAVQKLKDVKVQGKTWSLEVPAGLYAMTFSLDGFEPETIFVDTGLSDEVQVLPVQLSRRPAAKSSSEQKETQDEQPE